MTFVFWCVFESPYHYYLMVKAVADEHYNQGLGVPSVSMASSYVSQLDPPQLTLGIISPSHLTGDTLEKTYENSLIQTIPLSIKVRTNMVVDSALGTCMSVDRLSKSR